jgi:hypothetical protein
MITWIESFFYTFLGGVISVIKMVFLDRVMYFDCSLFCVDQWHAFRFLLYTPCVLGLCFSALLIYEHYLSKKKK